MPRAPPPWTLAYEWSCGWRTGRGAAAVPGPAGDCGGVSPVSSSSGGGLRIRPERTSSAAQMASMAGAALLPFPPPSATRVHSLPPPSCGGLHGRRGGDGVHGRFERARRRRPPLLADLPSMACGSMAAMAGARAAPWRWQRPDPRHGCCARGWRRPFSSSAPSPAARHGGSPRGPPRDFGRAGPPRPQPREAVFLPGAPPRPSPSSRCRCRRQRWAASTSAARHGGPRRPPQRAMAGRLELCWPDPHAVTMAELVAASSGGGTPHLQYPLPAVPRTPERRPAGRPVPPASMARSASSSLI